MLLNIYDNRLIHHLNKCLPLLHLCSLRDKNQGNQVLSNMTQCQMSGGNGCTYKEVLILDGLFHWSNVAGGNSLMKP